MKLNAPEIEQVKQQGAYLTEKCDICGRVLNQAFRYVLPATTEVCCSDACWQSAYDRLRAERKRL